MKVFALGGAGLFGLPSSRLLTASDLVTKIVVAGRNIERAQQAATELGDKASAVQVDACGDAVMRQRRACITAQRPNRLGQVTYLYGIRTAARP